MFTRFLMYTLLLYSLLKTHPEVKFTPTQLERMKNPIYSRGYYNGVWVLFVILYKKPRFVNIKMIDRETVNFLRYLFIIFFFEGTILLL